LLGVRFLYWPKEQIPLATYDTFDLFSHASHWRKQPQKLIVIHHLCYGVSKVQLRLVT